MVQRLLQRLILKRVDLKESRSGPPRFSPRQTAARLERLRGRCAQSAPVHGAKSTLQIGFEEPTSDNNGRCSLLDHLFRDERIIDNAYVPEPMCLNLCVGGLIDVKHVSQNVIEPPALFVSQLVELFSEVGGDIDAPVRHVLV